MKTTFENYILEVKDGIAYFTVNRPEVLNAMRSSSWAELLEFIIDVKKEDSIKAVIITGAGDKAFIAGADINQMNTATPVQTIEADSRIAARLMEECPKPIIAAINGYAFGGGFEVALACDIRIASTKARLGLPETNLGILPGGGGTIRLTRLAGYGVAKDVILAGRVLRPEESKQMGIVMDVVEPDQLLDKATEVAKTILDKGPLAIAISKRIIKAAYDVDIDTGVELLEGYGFATLLSTEDKVEGTAAFIEKRKANFQGK